jgi:23S rRNA (adenine2030-N6)-methyltransferase
MLSYRHAFHAGNPADVLKHMVLIFCLEYLGQKEKPYLVIDTHGGAGFYSLLEGYTAQNREWEGGVARLLDWAELPGRDLPPMIDRYVTLVQDGIAPAGRLRRYPGSPALIQKLLRPQDRAVCFELHPADFVALKDGFGADPRFRLRREDGLGGLKALLPPPSRRGCIFIDPSYEVKDDYRTLPAALAGALRRFPSGLYIIWYPLLGWGPGHPPESRGLGETLRSLYAGNRCGLELRTAQDPALSAGAVPSRGMYGSGLCIYNPPWALRGALEESLPLLASVLGGPEGNWNLRWEETVSHAPVQP